MTTQQYKFPIQIPVGLNLTLAQPFHVSNPVDISQALKIQTVDHLGVDIVCGTPEETWGQPVVWPFPWEGTVYSAQVDSTMGATSHAHCQIDTVDASTGICYSLIYLHLSSVTKTKDPTDNQVIVYREGDIIGHIGNNGAVQPKPTPKQPFNGTHLHLGLGIKKINEGNYMMVDPLIYFDINSPFRGPDYQDRDKPVYDWASANGAPTSLVDILPGEVQVLNHTTDSTVRQSLIKLIINQIKAFFGIE